MLDFDYDQYDLAGNIRNITDVGGGERGRTYAYDVLHRLTGAQLVAPGGGVAEQIDYDYDPVGNRLTRDVGGALETYDYDVFSNRLDSVTEGVEVRTLGYSASGNTESDDRGAAADRMFVYDSSDRLIQVDEGAATLATYAHNAMGQRVAKTVGGATTHYVYDLSGRLVAEADGATGAATAEYVWLEDMPLAFLHGGAIYYVHSDHLGTPQRLTDGSKAVVWDASYTPFGADTVSGPLTFIYASWGSMRTWKQACITTTSATTTRPWAATSRATRSDSGADGIRMRMSAAIRWGGWIQAVHSLWRLPPSSRLERLSFTGWLQLQSSTPPTSNGRSL